MWDMSRIVKGSPDLTAAFDTGSIGLHDRLRDLAESGNASAEDFWKLFGSFIDRFGTRGPNEWELRSRTWGIDPDVPLAAIDRMRFAPDDDSPQVRTELRIAEREAATDFVARGRRWRRGGRRHVRGRLALRAPLQRGP